MKKLIITTTFFLFCLLSIQAQEGFHWGFNLGMNLNNFKGKENDVSDYGGAGLGVNIGMEYEYQFKKRWMLRSGLNYSVKKTSPKSFYLYSPIDEGRGRYMDIRLGYLELPLTVGYEIPLKGPVSLIPEIGAFFACGVEGQLVSCTPSGYATYGGDWNPFKPFTGSYPIPEVNMDAFERFNGGLRFGITGKIYHFRISMKYDLGLALIQKRIDRDHGDLRTGTAVFGVSYLF